MSEKAVEDHRIPGRFATARIIRSRASVLACARPRRFALRRAAVQLT